MRPRSAPILVSLALLALAGMAGAAPQRDAEKLPVTRIEDLHYGDVLFYFYQDETFEAITRLNAYQQWELMPNHAAESELLLGGLYLSLGLHNEAGRRFEGLLTPDVPAGVRNRAWLYLAKIWYARGYYDRAERAIRQVDAKLSTQLEAEKQHLFANVLLRRGRFAEAEALLRDWDGPPDWLAYARYNMGVALVRQGRVDDAARFLNNVGTLETRQRELIALRDRANLALGYSYLQVNKPDKARPVLERVRLTGAYSNKALLGVGWADLELGNYRGALQPWMELRDRNLLDAAVQESYLAVPYAFSKLDANAQAAEQYETALVSFNSEEQRIDEAIARIRQGNMLNDLLVKDESTQYGWFWQLRSLPDSPESRYLYAALASHDFQEGLKNYRDIGYMGRTLDRWNDSLVAYDNMIETRELAYSERLPRADSLLASDAPERLQRQREVLEAELNGIERTKDVAALGTAEERDQWARIQQLEAALANAPDTDEMNALRDRVRLVKGVLYFRLNNAFNARTWQHKRSVKELEAALVEARNRWIRVDRARKSVPTNTGEFGARLAALEKRIAALQVRLAAAAERQNDYLERLAIQQLEEQKDRLNAYKVQARFALASIYDRAANAASEKPAEGTPGQPAPQQPLPSGSPQPDQTSPPSAVPPSALPPPGSQAPGVPAPGESPSGPLPPSGTGPQNAPPAPGDAPPETPVELPGVTPTPPDAQSRPAEPPPSERAP
jgi:hypothetical protein